MGHYASKFYGFGKYKHDAFNALIVYMEYYGCTDIYPNFFAYDDTRITFKYRGYDYDKLVVYKETNGFYHAYIF